MVGPSDVSLTVSPPLVVEVETPRTARFPFWTGQPGFPDCIFMIVAGFHLPLTLIPRTKLETRDPCSKE